MLLATFGMAHQVIVDNHTFVNVNANNPIVESNGVQQTDYSTLKLSLNIHNSENRTKKIRIAGKFSGLDAQKKTILLVGGSLGARTINESVLQHLDLIKTSGIQYIWQTGKYYHTAILEQLKKYEEENLPMLKVTDFISDMGAAYKAADLIISRAGASSISEFCLIGKPVILVPSPNVAEDHQTKNAMALVNKEAALYVKDAEAPATLLTLAVDTINDDQKLAKLSENILKLGLRNSADIIADEVIKLAQKHSC